MDVAREVSGPMTFHLSPSDLQALYVWREQHDAECPLTKRSKQGAAGGRFTYEFTPTDLSVVTVVTCACGQWVDLTDYDW